MDNANKKIDYFYYWRTWTFIFMMLSWIVMCFFMKISVWWLLPVYVGYFIINAIVFRAYFFGILGSYYLNTGRNKKAFDYFEKAVKLDTKNVSALYYWGLNLLQENKAEEALSYFKKAYDINTKALNEKKLLLGMSSCYWIMGDIDKGIETLETLMAKYEYVNPSVYTTMGYFWFLKEDCEKAKEYSKKALEDEETHAPAWDNLGQIAYKEGNTEEAEENFRKALEYNPNLVDSLYFMGEICEEKGDDKGAREYFEKAAGAPINALNTVKKEDIERKLGK